MWGLGGLGGFRSKRSPNFPSVWEFLEFGGGWMMPPPRHSRAGKFKEGETKKKGDLENFLADLRGAGEAGGL